METIFTSAAIFTLVAILILAIILAPAHQRKMEEEHRQWNKKEWERLAKEAEEEEQREIMRDKRRALQARMRAEAYERERLRCEKEERRMKRKKHSVLQAKLRNLAHKRRSR